MFLPTRLKTVCYSDDYREFAGCRRGGSQWACPETACTPRFHGKLPQLLSFAQNHLSIIISIVFVDGLDDPLPKIGAFLEGFNTASLLPPPSNFDVQRKDVLWRGIAIKMRAYNEHASYLCLLFILKRHSRNILWLRAALPSQALALFLAKFHARRMHA